MHIRNSSVILKECNVDEVFSVSLKIEKLMKHIFTISLAVLIISAIISCRKNIAVTIVGKWSLVNDSTFLAGTPILQGGSLNYIGIATDYYDFNSNGDLYIKKGNASDTAKYSVTSNNQVKFVYYSLNGTTFGSNGAIAGPYTITTHTEHNLTLTLSGITPEGEEFELINLKK